MNAEITKEKDVWRPHVTVAAVAERNGRFLMVEELVGGHIVYNQPAGHLEQNETIAEAVTRETFEESAWRFMPTGIIGVYFYRSPTSGVTYQRICFTGQCQKHEKGKKLDSSIVRAIWLSRDELIARPEKLRSPMVLRCIDDYLRGIRYPLSLFIDL